LKCSDSESKQRDLPFLIIGGHAVNAYGYSRFTKDLDILVNREQRDDWLAALERNGLSLFRDGGSFLQFNAPAGSKWPLDLMLVNAPTFAKLRADAREHPIGPQTFLVPSLDGLFRAQIPRVEAGNPRSGLQGFTGYYGVGSQQRD